MNYVTSLLIFSLFTVDSELPFAGVTSFETEESTCGNQWMCGKHISSMYSFFPIYLLLLSIIVHHISNHLELNILRNLLEALIYYCGGGVRLAVCLAHEVATSQ